MLNLEGCSKSLALTDHSVHHVLEDNKTGSNITKTKAQWFNISSM